MKHPVAQGWQDCVKKRLMMGVALTSLEMWPKSCTAICKGPRGQGQPAGRVSSSTRAALGRVNWFLNLIRHLDLLIKCIIIIKALGMTRGHKQLMIWVTDRHYKVRKMHRGQAWYKWKVIDIKINFNFGQVQTLRQIDIAMQCIVDEWKQSIQYPKGS